MSRENICDLLKMLNMFTSACWNAKFPEYHSFTLEQNVDYRNLEKKILTVRLVKEMGTSSTYSREKITKFRGSSLDRLITPFDLRHCEG